ncbi:hypothetical protein [Thalassolituus marinus]|uniref:Chromosome segregation ATPase n=1 Tax=Thalassolituus marinus TaxID=671053 RepID=A0ABS7ZTP3_9GAMM|nr:hypothetical protein [Thalassolituus marinus]MCA6063766.1 hypothetical protein [Thalassolituus marinus]
MSRDTALSDKKEAVSDKAKTMRVDTAMQRFDFSGFQRLVLLGSAGYSRAELPLDESVSLIAPNNTGKTSLINALQFLLIINKRRMDFGAHDVDKSRQFYFPNNSAYILLEATLPNIGTVVLGCVGKGVSHDFQYFAYKGQLNVDEFRTDDGKLVAQPELIAHLAQYGKSVFTYNPSDFANILYGGRVKRAANEPDFTVFRLENSRDSDAYQRVLTRTLRLDKLKSQDVKEHLLQIFKHDVTDSAIDFKQAWDKAFAEINVEREQYQIAVSQQARIDTLESNRDQRLVVRGQILAVRPHIEAALEGWEQFYTDKCSEIAQAQKFLEDERRDRLGNDRKLIAEQTQLATKLKSLVSQQESQNELERQFALISGRGELEQQQAEIKKQYDAITTQIGLVSSRTPSQIERDIKRNLSEQEALTRELDTLSDNLWQRLSVDLPEDQLGVLNRLFNREVMTLGANQFYLDTKELSRALSQMDANHWKMEGLSFSLKSLTPQYVVKSAAEIQQRQSELTEQHSDLLKQLDTAKSLDKAKEKKDQLYGQLTSVEQAVKAFDQLLLLRQQQPEREIHLAVGEARQHEIQNLLVQSEQASKTLDEKANKLNQDESSLNGKHQRISELRNRRVDTDQRFSYLADQPHRPWLGDAQVQLENLAEALTDYQRLCQQLLRLDGDITGLLSELHHKGLTKFQYAENDEIEIDTLINFRHQLSREAEALERRARSAVVNVTASLRDLRSGLYSLKRRMREFNSLIGARQLSDLTVFKIEAQDDESLVSAIDTLIDTAEKVESGETFALFNQASVLDDVQLDRARQRLIDECNARQGLRVADLFRLSFVVGKKDQAPESFDDLDSAASNGTVLMAKLITGLAMLHLMQDKRHRVKAICYLDEALALDTRNQASLIETAAEFGFSLIFASPSPLTTARYCVPISQHQGRNHISRESWHILEPLATDSGEALSGVTS